MAEKGNSVDPNTGMSESNMKKGEVQNQVNFFILGLIIVLIVSILVISSKFFRTFLSLKRLAIYKTNELNPKSIFDIRDKKGNNYGDIQVASYSGGTNAAKIEKHRLRDFYIASAYRPYMCYYHKYDYVSIEVFKEVLKAGPRMIELEIFNSDYGDKVEPVVSVGEENGEWMYTLNAIHIKQFLKAINETVFNTNLVGGVAKDPFIILLNLKTNKNIKCLNKLHKYIYSELNQHLLGTTYSYNAKKTSNTEFYPRILDIPLIECQNKVILFAHGDFEDTNLEEIINYSTVSNYTIKYSKTQRRMIYLDYNDIVETEEDIEDYANPEFHKVSKGDVQDYCNHSIGFLKPKVVDGDSLFTNISPINPEPGRGLEAGIQFIMMNYQNIDTNMSNYAYIFKDSSFVQKAITSAEKPTNITYVGKKVEDIALNQSELNYLYVTTKS